MPRRLATTAILLTCSLSMSVEAREEIMQSAPTSVVINWKFEHAPDLVWKAWTDPKWIAHWVGSDPNGNVRHVNTDVRLGGTFEFAFTDSDGTQHTARGVYREVVPNRKLAFSWSWANEPGVETSIVVDLAQDARATSMRFEHAGLTHASTHDYAFGWRSTFEKMENVLAWDPQSSP